VKHIKNSKEILKGAGVLLIAAVMILSATAVTANTVKIKKIAPNCLTECNQNLITKNIEKSANSQQMGADVLWNNGLPDGRNGVSCVYWPAYPLDREIIDNFEVTGDGWLVCDGHFRIVTYSGAGPEIIEKVRVFFYGSTGPCEPDIERYAERETTFNAFLTGDTYFDRPEIAIDCEFDCVNLTPGEWWVCFQPEMDDNSFWLTTGGDDCSIFASYPDQGFDKWTKGYPDIFTEEYDVSFQLTGEEIHPSNPDLECDGDLHWVDVKPGATIIGNFGIGNVGDTGSYLDWEVEKWPTWGTWTFDPPSGTDLPAGDWIPCNVTVVAPPDKNKEFTGVVKVVNKEDPSDFCEIQVYLQTPRNKITYNNLLSQLFENNPYLYIIIKNLL